MRRLRTAGWFSGYLWLASAVCGAAPALPDALPVLSDSYETYPALTINGVKTNLAFSLKFVAGLPQTSRANLDAMGLVTADLTGPADAEIPLDQVPGLSWDFSEAEQALQLHVAVARLKTKWLDQTPVPAPKPSTAAGALLNYDLSVTQALCDQAARSSAMWNEARFFNGAGYLSSSSVLSHAAAGFDPAPHFLRYDTYWQSANPARMQTWTWGDQISAASSWSRAVRMGGVGVARDFSLRPDLVTFPLPALGGSALVPSSVDLYLNGVRQYSGDNISGPFGFSTPPALTGAGNATVVVTDALGRSVTTEVPLYVDIRLLGAGTSDYGFNAGYIRRNYGLDSFDYSPDPAANASWRYGLSNTVTLEAHSEVTRGLLNGGAGGLLQLGSAGVVHAAAALSNGAGKLLQLGYQWVGAPFAIDLQTTLASDRYRDLASIEGSPMQTRSSQATFSMPLPHQQSLSFSMVGQRSDLYANSKVYSLGWSLNGWKDFSLYLNGYVDTANKLNRGVYANLSYRMGARANASLSLSKTAGSGVQTTVDLSRPVDYAGGMGWRLSASGRDDQTGRVDYRNSWNDAYLSAQHSNGQWAAYLGSAGALVYMDGAVQAARHIEDGFVMVSTDGVANVPVLAENQPVGVTGAGGHLLITDRNAYQHNRIAIDPLALPYDMQLETTQLDVSPQRRAGALARFPMRRYQSASFQLLTPGGQALPQGTLVTLGADGETVPVGYDGQVFFAQLAASNTLHAWVSGKPCTADLPFDVVKGGIQQLGQVSCHALATTETP